MTMETKLNVRKLLPLILVLGKPGAGKSWTASKIAFKFKLRLICPQQPPFSTAVSTSTSTADSPSHTQDNEDLAADQSVDAGKESNSTRNMSAIDMPDPIMPDFHALLNSNCRTVGLVVDGSCLNEATTSHLSTFLTEITAGKTHQLFIIRLNIDDEVLIQRRLNFWVDPTTGLLFRDEQNQNPPMKFSMQTSVETENENGGGEGEGGDENDEFADASNSENQSLNMPFDFPDYLPVDLTDADKMLILTGKHLDFLAGRSGDDGNSEENDAVVEQKLRIERFVNNQKLLTAIKTTPKWKLLEKDVRMRLRKREVDVKADSIKSQIQKYLQMSDRLFENLHLKEWQTLDVDSSQSPLGILYQIGTWIQIVPFRTSLFIDPPMRIAQNFEDMTMERALDLLSKSTGEEPFLRLAPSGTNCALTLISNNQVLPADPNFALSYRGKLYLFSNEQSLRLFEANAFEFSHLLDTSNTKPLLTENLRLEVLSEPLMLGSFKNFCPVSLKRGVLRLGNPSNALLYADKYYIFASEAFRNEFCSSNGKDFITSDMAEVPLPRIAISGPPASGKSTLIDSKMSHLPYVQYRDLVLKCCASKSDADRIGLMTKFDAYEDLPREVIVDALKLLLDLYKTTGFVLEDFPRTLSDAKVVFENVDFSFDAIINLTCDSDSAIKRKKYEEGYDDGKIADMNDIYDKYSKPSDSLLKMYEVDPSITTITIDGTLPLRQVENHLADFISKWIVNRDGLLYDCRELEKDIAKAYLGRGNAELGKFAYLCPVALSARKYSYVECIGQHPVLVGSQIFYIRNKANVKSFLENPRKYLVKDYYYGLRALTASICGDKDVLKRVSIDFQIPILDLKKAHESLLLNPDCKGTIKAEYSELEMTELTKLAGWAVKQASFVVHGFVGEHEILNLCIVPDKIFEIKSQTSTVSPEVKNNIAAEYLNKWILVDPGFNALKSVESHLSSFAYSLYDYCLSREVGRPCPCFDVNLRNRDINQKISSFGLYCPVTFVDQNDLVQTSDPRLYVEYQDKVYRCLGKDELQKFLADPNRYTDNLTLPDQIPTKMNEPATEPVKFKGYCPVSYSKGFLVTGTQDHLAKVGDEIYALSSNDSLFIFLKAPWKFTEQKLADSVPESLLNQALMNMKPDEYFESTLNGLLSQALLHLANEKPKFPFSDKSSSALKFIGLYLKAHNPNQSPAVRNIYREKYEKYLQCCKRLQELSEKIGSNSQPQYSDLKEHWETFLEYSK